MKEYIERERLKEAFYADLQTLQTLDEHTMNLILMEIDEAPAADVAPVRHGRWKNGGNGLYDTCSACGKEIYLAIPMNYCPECGALLDGKEEAQ